MQSGVSGVDSVEEPLTPSPLPRWGEGWRSFAPFFLGEQDTVVRWISLTNFLFF